MNNIKLAVQTQLWGNHNLEKDFQSIFEEVIKAGYDGVECRYTVLKQKEQLKAFLADHSLSILGVHSSPEQFYTNDISEKFTDLLQDLKDFKIKHLLFSPAKRETFDEQKKWLEIISKMADRCNDAGVELSYHNHAFEFENYGYDLFDEIEKHSNIGIALDIGWLYRAKFDLEEMVNKYHKKINYLHVKDTTNTEWRELGTGDVDIKKAVQILNSLNLEWWTIEQDTSELDPLKSATMSRDFLKTIGL